MENKEYEPTFLLHLIIHASTILFLFGLFVLIISFVPKAYFGKFILISIGVWIATELGIIPYIVQMILHKQLSTDSEPNPVYWKRIN